MALVRTHTLERVRYHPPAETTYVCQVSAPSKHLTCYEGGLGEFTGEGEEYDRKRNAGDKP